MSNPESEYVERYLHADVTLLADVFENSVRIWDIEAQNPLSDIGVPERNRKPIINLSSEKTTIELDSDSDSDFRFKFLIISLSYDKDIELKELLFL